MRRLRLLLLPLLSLTTACVDDGPGYAAAFLDATQTGLRFELRGDDPVLVIDASVFMDVGGEGQVHIDSARVTAVVDGQTTIYENPEVKTDDFPYTPTTEFESSNRRVVLEVPSPLTDAGTFDGFCRSNGRTLTIDLSFYAPQGDNGEGEPPLISTTGTLPLVPGGAPPAISAFASSGPMKVPSQLGVAPSLRLVPVGDEAIVISEVSPPNVGNFVPGVYNLYWADQDSVGGFFSDGGSFYQLPRVVEGPSGEVMLAARGGLSTLTLIALGSDGISQTNGYIEADTSTVPEFEALGVAALGRSATGYFAAVQSAFPLPAPGGNVAPPEGKYYGSFVVEIGPDLNVNSVTPQDRDVVFIDRATDGTLLVASNDLPPRDAAPTLLIERFDAAGEVLFSHEEPALTFEPVIHPLADGGVLFAYEEEQPGGRVEVVRLAADGAEVFRWVGVGFTPSVAPTASGGAFVTLVGTLSGIDAPERSLPLLLELDAQGEVVRGAQLACGGSAAVTGTESGLALLAGTFLERMTIGGRVTDSVPGDIIVATVE